MNKDLIERLWAQALDLSGEGMNHREAFAHLVANECAKVCEAVPVLFEDSQVGDGYLQDAGRVIRERFKP